MEEHYGFGGEMVELRVGGSLRQCFFFFFDRIHNSATCFFI